MASFVYCWTDHALGKLYIGYHKGSVDDGYICSSKWMLKEYKKRPQDFTRQIIATGNVEDMIAFETILLKTLKVKNDPQFYNLSENNPPPKGNTKKKRVPWNKGLKGVQVSWNKGMTGEQHHNYGKKYNVVVSKRHSEEHKAKARQLAIALNKRKQEEKLACPHCDYVGYHTTRWHWDNCRSLGG